MKKILLNVLKIYTSTIFIFLIYNCSGSTESSLVTACTDTTSCNYLDESNCLYEDCNGECGGAAIQDACGVCGGDNSNCESTSLIYYISSVSIGGFQFSIDGINVIGISGGSSEEAGFMMSTGNNNVIGFSMSGNAISAGDGILAVLEIIGTGNMCIQNNGLIISDPSGNGLCAFIENCNILHIDQCS